METISPDVQIILGILGVLFVIPGIGYLVVEKSHEYTGQVGPKKLGNVSYPPMPILFAGKRKNKSRKLRR
jgi:hypothetical protein